MSLFLIETKELKDVENGWKTIAKTRVSAGSVYEALRKVEKHFTKYQYIHEAISIKESRLDYKVQRYFY
ncbi:hypothetical protein JZO77_03620 [Enterococcus hulanensis]|uniref:hypothetical protein n=1 Tax=Enterococcus hulanensis TaxID=2559929 RepID=UPI0010F74304|nr:hypothetical protein [Enterococcus hulanensis]MBO0455827.1 hypothetical protein [Enterococcus hulanensis]